MLCAATAGALVAAPTPSPRASASSFANEPSYKVAGIDDLHQTPVAPQFDTAADLDLFQQMSMKARATPLPEARRIAKALIEETLRLDGDLYVVAHFASAADRARGVPDRALLLTDALMEAFPDHSRHSFFAGLADAVGGVLNGGAKSPSIVQFLENTWNSESVGDLFKKVGLLLWSRLGPVYFYNTFLAEGNVIDTVSEDARSLDDAFGTFRVGGFTAEHEAPLQLSQLVEQFGKPSTFAELPFVRRLDDAIDDYWQSNRADWPVLARYAFVQQAREARAMGHLTDAQYRSVMQGAAPHVPLEGPISLAALQSAPPEGPVIVRRFDINGYAATDLIRFVAPDGSEVMYVPGGDPAFVTARSERDLRRWAGAQANARDTLDALLSHFSIYDGQDGLYREGVKQGLERLRSEGGQGGKMADHVSAPIVGDVFDDMRKQVEQRLRADAETQASTAWEAWRATINRALIAAQPLGYIPRIAVPIQLITGVVSAAIGIEQSINGRTFEQRKAGAEQVATTIITAVPFGAAFGGMVRGGSPRFRAPQRVNGQIGYPLSPIVPPGWRTTLTNRLYLRRDGLPSRWVASDARRLVEKLPSGAVERADGVFMHGNRRFITLPVWGRGLRTVPIVADSEGYRIRLDDDSAGPLVERKADGTWQIAFNERNYLDGSILAELVSPEITTDPMALNSAAGVLWQWGSSEAALAEAHLANADASSANPLLTLALGHGIIETLARRLRHPSGTSWSAREVALLAPSLARMADTPLALYRPDASFELGVRPDGTAFTRQNVPADALHLQRRKDGYAVLADPRRPGVPGAYTSVFSAMAEMPSFADERRSMTAAQREADFRMQMADAIEARSTRPELQRMHRLWIDPMLPSRRQGQVLKRISRLRHALMDRHEGLTEDQQRWLRRAAEDQGDRAPENIADDPSALIRLLPTVVKAESALLPEGLAHLVVNEPAVIAHGNATADAWIFEGRHYVRLRHLDGQTQVVETSMDGGGYREILRPGDAPDRASGRFVVERDGLWYPETELADGFAPVDPAEYVGLLAAITEKLPQAMRDDLDSIARIVDTVPGPLVRFVRRGLASVDVSADGGLILTVRHSGLGDWMRYFTHVDMQGRPVPSASSHATELGMSVLRQDDKRLVLTVPRSTSPAEARSLSAINWSTYQRLLQAESPVSSFMARGVGDRHVSTLVNTRRLRGMLREDAHIAVVGATPGHVMTLVMPVNAESLSVAGSGPESGRLIADLPADTIIFDEMFRVRAYATDYARQVRERALAWQASGIKMKRFDPAGPEIEESPVTFAERVLSSPVSANLWSPANDPISEVHYVAYMRNRYATHAPVVRAGVDWLQTRAARRDYMSYFAPPFDVFPDGQLPPSHDVQAQRMHDLTDLAVTVEFSAVGAPGAPTSSLGELVSDRPKEPVRAAGG